MPRATMRLVCAFTLISAWTTARSNWSCSYSAIDKASNSSRCAHVDSCPHPRARFVKTRQAPTLQAKRVLIASTLNVRVKEPRSCPNA
eukprot:938479-Rhodomonas_salina.1